MGKETNLQIFDNSPIPLVAEKKLNDSRHLTKVFLNLNVLRNNDPQSRLIMAEDENFLGPVLCLSVEITENGEPVNYHIPIIVKGQLEIDNENEFLRWLMNDLKLFTGEELAPVWNSLNEQSPQDEQLSDEAEISGQEDKNERISPPENIVKPLTTSEQLESFIGLGILPVEEDDIDDMDRQFQWLGEQRSIKTQKYVVSLETDENGPKLVATIQTPRSDPILQDLIYLRTFQLSEVERAVVADRVATDHQQRTTAMRELIQTKANNLNTALQLLMKYNVITKEDADAAIRKYGRNAEYACKAVDGVGFGALPKWVSVIKGWEIEKASDLYNKVIQLRENICMLDHLNFRSRWIRISEDMLFEVDLMDRTGKEINLISASVSEDTDIKETESYIRLVLRYYSASGLINDQMEKKISLDLANKNEDIHDIVFFQSKIHGSLSKAIIGREKPLDTVSLFFPNHDHKINTHIVYRKDSGTKRDIYYSTVLPEEMSATFESRLWLAKAVGLSIESKDIEEQIKRIYAHIAYESLPVVMRTAEGKLALVLKYPYEQYSADINHTWLENSAALAMIFSLDRLYRQYELLID